MAIFRKRLGRCDLYRASGELREMDPDAIKEAIRSFRAAAMPATSEIKDTATLDPSEEVHLDTF